ncbi:peptidase M19 [Polaribacter reichenbachii]|uniref:Peptidase M19 n=1 Tax=Polaribacter reichenbachii TaxID=996801 RepID=A0A1B8TPV5_9FLAO|nr:dipeptidase [Polaribacter reichenbachii]APZ46816.1 peptidase M19 [Polaribacter reichenbachii]AUC17459.1 peptidase M19 [Polaribacter reichenbachii]OBY61666.1 peptidase M19 [Polaribacter reichenbachii]
MKLLKLLPILLLVISCKQEKTKTNLLEKAQDIHKRVMTLDTHVDINVSNFTDSINYTQKLKNQVNLPNMEKGGLDVAFFIVYTGQGELNEEGYAKAYNNAISKFTAIHKLTNDIAPERISLAVNSNEAKKIYASGKKVAMIGVENAYPLGTDIKRVKEFYDLGARYMSLSHNGHSQLCDSNTGEVDDVWLHNGVSDFGKEVIKEMNKWGIMIDVSHPSKKSMKDMIELSKAPIIASHSSARALCNHSRNLDDEQLEWLKNNGGVVQAVAFKSYVNTEKNDAYSAAIKDVITALGKEINFEMKSWGEVRKMETKDRQEYIESYRELSKKAKSKIDIENFPPVDVADFVDHIDYLVDKIGINHVGISSDFDGGGGVEGWNDASETLNVTIELVKRGYSESQIEQLWNGNLLRVLDEVAEVAKKIQAEEL